MRQIKKGSADRSVVIRIIDSTDGTPEEGVLFNTAGIDLWYRREGAIRTAITEVTLATLDAAHADGGFLAIDDGYYRLDLPDAAWSTGASHVMIGGVVTGMIVIGQEVQLVNFDPEDTVRLGLTALPNAAANAAGGLPISAAGGLALDTKLANTNEVTAARMGALTDWIDGGRLDLILDIIAADTTTDIPATLAIIAGYLTTEIAEIYAAVITNAAGVDVAADIIAVKAVVDTIVGRVVGTIATGTHNPQGGDSFARLGAPAGASVSADVAAVKTDTGNLVTRITSALFSGITSLAQWLGLIAGKQVGNATALTEIKATGAGAGTFNEATDSLEAIRDTAPLGTAMRGTDNAALASVCTEARLTELDAANIPADVDTLKTRIPGVVQPQTGDSFARLGAPAGVSVSADIAVIESQTDDIGIAGAGLTALGDARLANLDAAISTRSTVTTAQVNTEVVDALNVDTYAEPGQESPAATVSLVKKIGYLFKAWRNKKDNNGTENKLYADDATTVDQKASTTEAAGTVTEGEWVTGL